MSSNYLKQLRKNGKLTLADLKKLEGQIPLKRKKANIFGFLSTIYNKTVNEFLVIDKPKLQNETPEPGFEQVGSDYEAKAKYDQHLDKLSAGKYCFKHDDTCGNWKKGDTVDIANDMEPKKQIVDKNVYEVNVNRIAVFVSKDFLTPITEDEGGGGIGVSTGDIASYETPMSKHKPQKKKTVDLFWGENELMNGGDNEEELDECGTDFTYTWDKVKKGDLGEVSNDVKKKLKIHSPELLKKK